MFRSILSTSLVSFSLVFATVALTGCVTPGRKVTIRGPHDFEIEVDDTQVPLPMPAESVVPKVPVEDPPSVEPQASGDSAPKPPVYSRDEPETASPDYSGGGDTQRGTVPALVPEAWRPRWTSPDGVSYPFRLVSPEAIEIGTDDILWNQIKDVDVVMQFMGSSSLPYTVIQVFGDATLYQTEGTVQEVAYFFLNDLEAFAINLNGIGLVCDLAINEGVVTGEVSFPGYAEDIYWVR